MMHDRPKLFASARAATSEAEIPLHDVRAIVGEGSLAHIKLNDQVYTLRITRQGKLILTK